MTPITVWNGLAEGLVLSKHPKHVAPGELCEFGVASRMVASKEGS